ncbi:5-(carboxyamino)imidazole ribonucleotide synthase [Niabella drilacis]|uniref:N5-carboxyaminoimidazole ribonucleotide synthase n=1 Tax=Niabella drilacis (strain DSM 25811 / CCM 8410 / CCUG 62505 / LMG 26954 / E90) TaxID=1285928 RepID=A0A1G6IT64_NIADE|nr:5-(carboxyamino)imidazole ribonucleotide synthase [Niabella drilacis]SDC09225.1 5-(carboxyamino)imidazole ribonucleotide synthase [Niabella drilacis]
MQKVGILGGGQLGRMLLQAAANYPVETYILENDDQCPAAHLCHHFFKGDIRDYDAVYAFGKGLDALTIEIENVNVDALETLEKEGVTVIPHPSVLRTIRNKAAQKKYYTDHQIPTAEYILTHNIQELSEQAHFFPAVHKIAEGGYDGRGVQIIENEQDVAKGFDAMSVLEKKVDVAREIAMMIAIDRSGAIAIYPAVQMVFDKTLNLLDFQLCPADIEEKTYWKAEAIALSAVKNFNSPGIFAVELFVTPGGEVLVNETAPRVHNSGHHTIEAHYSSQFDMVWRILLNYPLGSTDAILPSVMLNIIGKEGYSGEAVYEGLDEMLKIENAFFHLYGKRQTKAGRKMGHVTIISNEKADLLHKANKIKHGLSVIAKE